MSSPQRSTYEAGSPWLSGPQIIPVVSALSVVLLTATALRLYRLDDGLWLDEIIMYVSYVKMPLGTFLTTYESENQHFLYILLARFSIWIFGDTVWSLRLPAVFFGVVSIWALYLFGRKVSTTQEALFSAALFAVSYHHIWFSQNARGYIGLLFWSTLCSWLFLQGLEKKQPAKWWAFYAITTALGIYTHLIMGFVFLSHFIIYIISLKLHGKGAGPNTRLGFFVALALAGVLVLLLYAPVVPQVISYISKLRSIVPVWKNPVWTVFEFLEAMRVGFAGSMGAAIALLIFGAGLVSFVRIKPVVIQLLVIPSVICAAVVIGVGHHLWPRFFIFTMGFAALVIVRGTMITGDAIAHLVYHKSKKSFPIGAFLCVGLICVSAVSAVYAYGPKQDYQGALAFVQANRAQGDVVVIPGLAHIPYQKLYKTDWRRVDNVRVLKSIRSTAKRTWLVYTLPFPLRVKFPEIMSSIERDFRVVKEFPGTLAGGTIYVCRSDSSLPLSESASRQEIFPPQ